MRAQAPAIAPARPAMDVGRLPDAPSSLLTLDDFRHRVRDGQKADLIEGVITVASPASERHERLFDFLHRLLGDYVELRDLGIVRGSRTMVEVDDLNGYEPDLLFVSRERLGIVGDQSIVEPPDWVVEIVSPATRRQDAYAKRAGYERLRVPEYWLIDPDNQVAVFYRLTAEGYVPGPVEEGVYRSQAVPGFWLRTDWLWADKEHPHPRVVGVLRELDAL